MLRTLVASAAALALVAGLFGCENRARDSGLFTAA